MYEADTILLLFAEFNPSNSAIGSPITEHLESYFNIRRKRYLSLDVQACMSEIFSPFPSRLPETV